MAKVLVTLVVLCVLGSVSMHGLFQNKEYMTRMQDCIMESGYLSAPAQNKDHSFKCINSCLMKKYNIMDANGKLDKEAAILLAYKIFGPRAADIVKMIDICSKMYVPKDHCEAAFEYIKCAKLQEVTQIIENELQ